MDCCLNTTLEYDLAYDPNELHFLEIKLNMEILCGDCAGCYCFPHVIVMSLSKESPPPPEGMAIVGPVFDFTGYKDSLRHEACSTATFFDPSVVIQLSYDPVELPEGGYSPVIAFFDKTQGLWVTLPPDTGRVAEVGKLTGVASYFASPFTILVNVPPAGSNGETTVLHPINWWLIGGIIAALILIGWLVWYLWYRKNWSRIWSHIRG
jgi:hypothetical protein